MDMFEDRKYFTPFIVYKWMDWWPFFDFLAMYGHIVHNSVIVLLSINLNVSIFMCLNLIGVCAFYTVSTFRLQARASQLMELFGL